MIMLGLKVLINGKDVRRKSSIRLTPGIETATAMEEKIVIMNETDILFAST
ncbi:hypothetical protein M5X11_34750 [Paenibacillus alginolyticus]|uniref:hypothetical protein n=1 Tax=Paenibacillus alginolyticus TaxID=59839 RepID=UPI000405535D|nr:hypothetical protein [Paenibacillus alginolyticus]MCY9669999.1 hypothetical protein [Paenibacillus alginolyticus]